MKSTLSDTSQRRFAEHRRTGDPKILARDHPAAVARQSLFHASRIADPNPYETVLKSGHNSVKIGRRITKGRWRGMEVFTLTLEERASCPPCQHFYSCYGNKMHWPTRWKHGRKLTQRLGVELRDLARRYPQGFVVRLHVLGDFYSLVYVAQWLEWLIQIPQLHVYGYTAHDPNSVIGQAIATIARHHWNRFAIRFSDAAMPTMATRTIAQPDIRGRTPMGIVCPAQTGDTSCCATCALCWGTRDNIVFLEH